MRKKIHFPIADEIIEANKRVLEDVKVRKADRHQVLASEERLNNIILSARKTRGNIFDKAVNLITELVKSHPFASGNRRTAFAVTMQFLLVNGFISPLFEKGRYGKVLLGIRESYYSKKEIKKWLMTGEIREFER